MKSEDSAAQKIKAFYNNHPLKKYQRGEIVVLPNDEQLPPVTYIEDGLIGQFDITTEGKKVMVNIFKPGAFFPVSSAINKTYNTYYFEALTDIQVRQAQSDSITLFLQENPNVTYDLLQRVYRGVDGVLKRMVLLLGETANARVVYELFMYADRFGRKQTDGSVVLDITASAIAQQTGLTRETISRELKKLKESGVLIVTRGQIRLLRLGE
jgi:CRP-like cAMP-binding protein